MKLKFIPIAFLGAALVACGGGGGGGGASTTPAPAVQTNTAFSLTAKRNNSAVGNFLVNAGEGKVLGINAGDEVELIPSTSAILLSTSYGKATPDIRSNTSTSYRAAFNSTDHTVATLVFAMTADPTKVARVTLTIKGASPIFNAVTPARLDAFTYAENDKRLDGVSVAFPDFTHLVTSVNSDGSWNEDFVTPQNVIFTKVNFSAAGNRVGYQAQAADPAGCKDARFEPQEALLVFPLSVGTPYSTRWTTKCLPNDSQIEDLTASVVAYEQVITRGGVFNALKITQSTKVTSSTDARLPGRGYEQDVTVWFDPILGRNVKYSGVRRYPGGEPTDKTQFLSEVSIELINAIKN